MRPDAGGEGEFILGPYVQHAVLGNVGTLISFRLGPEDAHMIAREFEPVFAPQDLVNLPNHDIDLRLMIDGTPSKPFSATTLHAKILVGKKRLLGAANSISDGRLTPERTVALTGLRAQLRGIFVLHLCGATNSRLDARNRAVRATAPLSADRGLGSSAAGGGRSKRH